MNKDRPSSHDLDRFSPLPVTPIGRTELSRRPASRASQLVAQKAGGRLSLTVRTLVKFTEAALTPISRHGKSFRQVYTRLKRLLTVSPAYTGGYRPSIADTSPKRKQPPTGIPTSIVDNFETRPADLAERADRRIRP